VNGIPFQLDQATNLSLRHARLWLVLTAGVGMALRLFRLGTKSFRLDEAATAILSAMNWHNFGTAIIHRQANMVFYYLLLRGWTSLGSSEFVLRFPSVIAGVAAVPAIYFLGSHLLGPRAGRIAALLLSVHAFHIRYSQEARAYTLSMLLAVVSSLFFLRSVERSSRKSWTAYVLVSVLMVYAQAFSGWLLLAQWVSLLFWRREICWKQVLFMAGMICLLISPLAFCLLVVSDRSQLFWLTSPTLHDFYKFCINMTGDGGLSLLVAYGAMVLVGVGTGIRRMRSEFTSADRWKYCFLLTWLLLPVASVLSISLRWPAFEPRFLIFCLPAFVLLVADAVTQIHSKVLFAAALMIMLGLSLRSTLFYCHERADDTHTDDWRDATSYILTQAEVGDAVLFSYSEEKLAFDEYQRRFRIAGSSIHEFPERTDLELLTERPSRPSVELLDKIAAGHNRVWVVSAFQPNQASCQVDAGLASRFRAREARSFGFVHAKLFADPIFRP